MPTFNLHAAKTHFSRLVDDAASGQEVIIAKAGTPVAKLVSLEPSQTPAKRKLGVLAGQVAVPPGFDAPLPDAVLDAFEEG